MESNDKKSQQLGISFGKAQRILMKSLFWKLIKDLNLDVCYRCKKKIESSKDLSVDHIIPWLDSENPSILFFNLDNITFSHLKCNISCARKGNNKKYNTEEERKEAIRKRGREAYKKLSTEDKKKIRIKRREKHKYYMREYYKNNSEKIKKFQRDKYRRMQSVVRSEGLISSCPQ